MALPVSTSWEGGGGVGVLIQLIFFCFQWFRAGSYQGLPFKNWVSCLEDLIPIFLGV